MIYTPWTLLCSDIISKYQVKFVQVFMHPCNRRYSVMRYSVSLTEYKCRLITVGSPTCQNMVGRIYYPADILALKSDNGHRPFYNSCIQLLITFKYKSPVIWCLCHCKYISSTLKMVMT